MDTHTVVIQKEDEEEVAGQHLWRLQGDGHFNLWAFTTCYRQDKMEEHCTPMGCQHTLTTSLSPRQ